MFRFIFLVTLSFFLSCGNLLAAPSANDFGALPVIHDAALSPDGDKIAVLVKNDEKYIIRILELSNLKDTSRMIALESKMKPQYLKWVNDKRVMLSFWQSEKIGTTPIRTGYLYSLDTQKMQGSLLIDPTKSEASNFASTDLKFRQFNNVVVDWLQDDPDHILMTFGENNLDRDLRRVDVKSGRDFIVKRGVTNVQTWYTDRTGQPRIGQGRKEKDGSWVLRIKDVESEKWRFSEEFPGLSADVDIHGFTSNPNELIISDYQGQDTLGLYIYDLIAKKITRKIYHNDSYDASGVVTDSDGDVIGARYIAESPETEMLPGHSTIMDRMSTFFEGYIVQYISRSEDGETVLFKISNETDPGYLMIAEKDGKPRNLGKLRPAISPNDLGPVIGLEYTARDNQQIPSFITIPPSITDMAQFKNLPFIVLPHGGPYARDSKRFDYFAQFFASRGYGVLQMNFRGSEGYGKAFKETGRNNWVVMQEDVEDGTKWLISEGYADPARICIVGWSYGGYAALLGAAKNPDLYNCAVSVAGLTDIKDFKQDLEKYRFGKVSAKKFFGSNFKDKDDIKENSPVKLASQIKIPVFLAHGRRDQIVHFDQFTRMKSALKRSPSKVTSMDFKDGDHYFSIQKDRQEFLSGLEKFLVKANGKSEFMQ